MKNHVIHNLELNRQNDRKKIVSILIEVFNLHNFSFLSPTSDLAACSEKNVF